MSKTGGGCTPCATERKERERLNSPLFPVDFPCPHPRLFAVPSLPARYTADRFCAECSRLVPVEVRVQDPKTIGYRCSQGHMWLASGSGQLAARKTRRPVPVPVLAGKTGRLVAVDDDDRPPWEADTP